MTMPVRLVVSDIDGTLVRHDKSLPEENVAAIAELVARGVAVSLISARPPSGMAVIAERLGLTGSFGAFNGGTIWSTGGAIQAEHRVPSAIAARLLDLYAGEGVTRWLFSGGKWFSSDTANPHTPREVLSAGIEPVAVAGFGDCLGDVDKLVAVCDDHARLAQIERRACALASSEATVVRSQAYYLDVTALQANKGDGVAALATLYGVPLEAVAVLGDNENDVAMFRRAGLSVAMGQATPPVQAEASHVAASNEDNGVADAIRRFVLPRVE